jgi:hypothetical protein
MKVAHPANKYRTCGRQAALLFGRESPGDMYCGNHAVVPHGQAGYRVGMTPDSVLPDPAANSCSHVTAFERRFRPDRLEPWRNSSGGPEREIHSYVCAIHEVAVWTCRQQLEYVDVFETGLLRALDPSTFYASSTGFRWTQFCIVRRRNCCMSLSFHCKALVTSVALARPVQRCLESPTASASGTCLRRINACTICSDLDQTWAHV